MYPGILYNFLQGALKFSRIFTIYYQFLTLFILCLHIFYNFIKYYQFLTLGHYLHHLYKYLQFRHNFYKFSKIFYKFSYYFHQFLEVFTNIINFYKILILIQKYNLCNLTWEFLQFPTISYYLMENTYMKNIVTFPTILYKFSQMFTNFLQIFTNVHKCSMQFIIFYKCSQICTKVHKFHRFEKISTYFQQFQ